MGSCHGSHSQRVCPWGLCACHLPAPRSVPIAPFNCLRRDPVLRGLPHPITTHPFTLLPSPFSLALSPPDKGFIVFRRPAESDLGRRNQCLGKGASQSPVLSTEENEAREGLAITFAFPKH